VTGKASRKKRSAKSTSQRDDRAYEEFERLTKNLKKPRTDGVADPAGPGAQEPSVGDSSN
jgi:hypothetical protein